jgi:hypothetical protein
MFKKTFSSSRHFVDDVYWVPGAPQDVMVSIVHVVSLIIESSLNNGCVSLQNNNEHVHAAS